MGTEQPNSGTDQSNSGTEQGSQSIRPNSEQRNRTATRAGDGGGTATRLGTARCPASWQGRRCGPCPWPCTGSPGSGAGRRVGPMQSCGLFAPPAFRGRGKSLIFWVRKRTPPAELPPTCFWVFGFLGFWTPVFARLSPGGSELLIFYFISALRGAAGGGIAPPPRQDIQRLW